MEGLVVGSGSVVGSSRCSVVATLHRLVVSVVVKRTVRSSDSRACHVSVMAGSVVTGTRSKSSMAGGGGGRNSSNLRIAKLVVALLALPELGTGAASVVVGRARAKALLLLVMASQKDLDGDGKKEEESSNDGNSETSGVQPASGAKRGGVGDLVTLAIAAKALLGVAGSVAKGSVDVAGTARRTIASEDGDSDHGTAAKDVEDQAKESEESLSTKAAGEDNGEDSVKNCSTGETSDGLLPSWDVDIAISLNCEEVGVDSKNDCSATELEGIKARRDEL